MPRPPSTPPTDVELRILSILWTNGPSPVRVTHEQFSAGKQTNYSTTVKMLSVMLDKGLLTRDETVRPHVYRAVRSQAATQKRMLRELIDKVYAVDPRDRAEHAAANVVVGRTVQGNPAGLSQSGKRVGDPTLYEECVSSI